MNTGTVSVVIYGVFLGGLVGAVALLRHLDRRAPKVCDSGDTAHASHRAE